MGLSILLGGCGFKRHHFWGSKLKKDTSKWACLFLNPQGGVPLVSRKQKQPKTGSVRSLFPLEQPNDMGEKRNRRNPLKSAWWTFFIPEIWRPPKAQP